MLILLCFMLCSGVNPNSLTHIMLQDCVKTLPLLQKSNDVSLAKSLSYLAWHPKDGKVM